MIARVFYMLMRHRHFTLPILFLFSILGYGITGAPIDSHGYWPLTYTSLEIKTISDMIEMSAKENHHIPRDTRELDEVFGKLTERSEPHAPLDRWMRPYVYKVLDAPASRFVVYSAGPDGIDNGGDGDDVVGGSKNYNCELYHSCLDAKDYANRGFLFCAALVLVTWIAVGIYSAFRWITARRRTSAEIDE